MLAKLLALCLPLTFCVAAQTPKLLLTPQRLRRLQRDRERQTDRWLNFEQRVKTVPGSAERGFELALYYAVTQDQQRGHEAINWALKHECDERQDALVLDWTADLITDAERSQLLSKPCVRVLTGRPPGVAQQARDQLFLKIARGEDIAEYVRQVAPQLLHAEVVDHSLYDVVEFLDAVRSTTHVDLRETDRDLFVDLPQHFLLSMRPEEIEHPEWRAHIAALALATLDPNLEGSQFLQGWAMEDRFTLRDGPGVAYEFLWANPYLPGISYQNMDPWLYDDKGLLLARGGWSQLACWVEISASGTQQQNCPPNWESQTVVFGHLTLVPFTGKCVQVEREDRNESIILWRLSANEKMTYPVTGESQTSEADAAGMWRVPAEAHGKMCTAKQ